MQNERILHSFENSVLLISFLKDAVVTRANLEAIYEFANRSANGKRYGVLFEAFGPYTVEEGALEFITRNPHNKNVIAKAYVVDTKEAKMKTSLHVIFDKPEIKPFTFPDKQNALQWLYRMIIVSEK